MLLGRVYFIIFFISILKFENLFTNNEKANNQELILETNGNNNINNENTKKIQFKNHKNTVPQIDASSNANTELRQGSVEISRDQVIKINFDKSNYFEQFIKYFKDHLENNKDFALKYKNYFIYGSIIILYLLIGSYINSKAKKITKKNTFNFLKFTENEELIILLNNKELAKSDHIEFLKKRFLKIDKVEKLIQKLESYFKLNFINIFFTFIPIIFKENKKLQKDKNKILKKISFLKKIIKTLSK